MTSHPEFNRDTSAYTVTSTFASSVKDKVILITGVNNGGLGGTTAKALAAQSPKLLILTGRTPTKVNVVIDAIAASHPGVACKAVSCELSSLAAVRAAAAEINGLTDAIDIVINNAGVMALPDRQLSTDGIELQFATNHVGHFLLTNLLMPKLQAAAAKSTASGACAPVRIVNVSSWGHNFSPVRFDDLLWETPLSALPEASKPAVDIIKAMGGNMGPDDAYNMAAVYGNTKTANVLFSVAINSRIARSSNAGSKNIASFALHPGAIQTELGRHMNPADIEEMRARAGSQVKYKTLEQGASTQLVAALDPELKVSGVDVYLHDCQVADAAKWARDAEAAEKLWVVSEELVGQKFEI